MRRSQAWVFDRAPVGLAVIDGDGLVVTANATLLRMFGHEGATTCGQHLSTFLDRSQHDAARAWLEICLRDEATHHFVESWLRPHTGESVWASIHCDRVVDPSQATSLVVAVTDLTEQRRRDEALEATQDDLIRMVELSPIAMVRLDATGRVLNWNPSAEHLLGWTEAEVVGTIAPIVPEGDRVLHQTLLGSALEGTPLEGRHLRLVAKDGSVVVTRTWAHLGEGEPVELLVRLVDVTHQDEAERALRAAEHRSRTLVENISDTVTLLDAEGRVRSTSGEAKSILGYPEETWTDRSFTELVHPDDLEALQPVIERVRLHPGAEAQVEARLLHRDGSWAEVAVTAVNLLHDPAVQGVVLTTHNITDRKRAERLNASQTAILELLARDADLDEVLNAIAEMVEDHDEGSQATVVIIEDDRLWPRAHPDRGPGAELRAALSRQHVPEEVQDALRQAHGRPVVVHDALSDPRTTGVAREMDAAGLRSLWWASAESRGSTEIHGGVIAFHRDDRSLSPHVRRVVEVACTLLAVALERHSTVTALAHRDLHDDLTGLPNRALLIDRLETGLERAHRSGEEVALLYVDLDRFKRINDDMGLRAGDEVLTRVAEHLRSVTRPGDTLARVGADEFAILCDQPAGLSTALAVADRLVESLREPIAIGGREVFVTASLGVAVSTPGVNGPRLLRNADAAMDRAKERGRNRLEVYDPAMRATAHDRLALGSDLRRALEDDQLRVLYQPIVDLASRAVVGAEALLRWHHPTRGEVPPAMFIPVAEELGLIADIGAWVLDAALEEMSTRAMAEAEDFTLSVNLSARQLDDPDLVTRVQSALARHEWPAERLCLELTETALTDDLDLALHVLERLRATGARIAVDDFGTGYSSLTHLQRLPIDTIKIDRSFVQGLGRAGGPERSTIARAVLGIASAMELEAIAEGIEEVAELEALRRLGCRLGQGYLFSVPVPADSITGVRVRP